MNQKYRYVEVEDVYRTAGLREDVISRDDVESQIDRAEVFACRLTKNIYYKYNLENVDVSSATVNSITTSETWIPNDWVGQYVMLTSGTGRGQIRKITSNTSSTLTIDRNFLVTPDATSSLSIFYVPKSFNPYKDFSGDDALDGNNRRDMFLQFYPLVELEHVSINGVSVTPTTVYKWKKKGKIELSPDSEFQVFIQTRPQLIELKYWYGVPDISHDIKRLVELKTSLQVLNQQMGGTFDVPSTFSLPDLNVSIGQAYINIKGTIDAIQKEYDELIQQIKIYPVFA